MILMCIERHPRGWGTEPNFHDAAQLGFEGVGQETFCSPSFFPSLCLFLSFPFWVLLGEVGGIGTSSFPCDEHKSCTNRIQTWGSW